MIDWDLMNQEDEGLINNEFGPGDSYENSFEIGTSETTNDESLADILNESNSLDFDSDDNSLFGTNHSEDELFANPEHGSHNVSFGMHVEDREWNMDQAKWYEDIEKREQHEADLDIEKGNIKEARDHVHAAESARKMKEEYIRAAKNCKK